VIAIYTAADGTKQITKQPFVSMVKTIKPLNKPLGAAQAITPVRRVQVATRTCNVLNLNLGPLHLALLGLIVDLDKVVLTITADSNGGLLGSLLCGGLGGLGGLTGGLGGLTGGSGAVPSPTAATTAARLTQAAQQSGLAAGPGFQVPLLALRKGVRQLQALPPVPSGVCTVLDLPLGPLDLNLLGLMVHLDATELRITADPTGGLLGSLLCGGLLGGSPTTTPATPPTG